MLIIKVENNSYLLEISDIKKRDATFIDLWRLFVKNCYYCGLALSCVNCTLGNFKSPSFLSFRFNACQYIVLVITVHSENDQIHRRLGLFYICVMDSQGLGLFYMWWNFWVMFLLFGGSFKLLLGIQNFNLILKPL